MTPTNDPLAAQRAENEAWIAEYPEVPVVEVKPVSDEIMKAVPMEAFVIKSPINGLDPIHVFWMNVGVGQGYVTLLCYGNAWTCYFGAMGGKTIQEFFEMADAGYLANKMAGQFTKVSKRHDAYLGKIIDAVKSAMAASGGEASGR